MYKRIILILVAFFSINTILSVLPSCKRPVDRKRTSPCYDNSCFTMNEATFHAYNSASHRVLYDTANEVKATDLTLSVQIKGTGSTCYRSPGSSERNFSLFSKAYALYAPTPCLLRQGNDSIVAYNIYSDKNYDASHPAGSSLNDIITSDDIPSKVLYGNYTDYNALTVSFLVEGEPETNDTHTFTIKLIQQDGDTLSVTGFPLYLFK